MSTAVVSTTEKIRSLLGKAEEIQVRIDELLVEQNQVWAEVRDTADVGSGDFQVNTTSATTQVATKKAANGRKAASPKAASPKAASPKAASPKKGTRNGNKPKLREVLWDVMDRSPTKWRKILPDLEKGVRSLRLIEIVKIITDEGKWVSKSADISPQVSNCIKSFRDQGKMARGDGVRYYIVGGAEIDGPSLDDKGNPIEE